MYIVDLKENDLKKYKQCYGPVGRGCKRNLSLKLFSKNDLNEYNHLCDECRLKAKMKMRDDKLNAFKRRVRSYGRRKITSR